MPNYFWKGIKEGNYAEGEISALSNDEAAFLLRKDKIIITSLAETASSKRAVKSSQKEKKLKKPPKSIPSIEVVIFTKKLAAMVRSGLPILETIKMLQEQTEHSGMRYVITEIYTDVERGVGLSDAFSKHTSVFDNVYINMLRAGESSGQIDEFMAKLVEGMEKQQAIRKKVKKALSYPVILLCVAVGVIALMMIYVVPVFQDMFKNHDGGLPGPTQLVVSISEFIRNPAGGGLLAATLVGTFVGIRYTMKTSASFRYKIHQLILKLPVVGDLTRNSSLTKIAMVQGNLTAAGVSVLESIDIATRSLDNDVIKEAMTEVKRGVYSGSPLSELFKKRSEIFPITFSAMVQVGERTGRLDEMFASITQYYEEETESSVEQLTGMLEPIMIVFLGGTIGFVLVAMYLPMFAMGQTI